MSNQNDHIQRLPWLLMAFGLLYWPLEAAIHVYLLREGTFLGQLLAPGANELWMRLLVTATLFVFGFSLRRMLQAQNRLIERLQRQKIRLSRIIETTYDAYVCIDEAGRIIEWNPKAEKLFGWSKPEAVGRELAEMIIPKQYRAAHRKGMENYLRTGSGPRLYRTIRTEAVHRDGREMRVEMAIVPLATEQQQEFYAFIREC